MRTPSLPSFLASLGAAAVATALVAIPGDAGASVSFAMSLEEVTRSASVVARVTPLEATSAWEAGRIVTYTTVRVDAIVAGSAAELAGSGAPAQLRVRTLGGRVGGVGQLVEGEAALPPSRPALVFLAPAAPAASAAPGASGASRVARVVGRAQGLLAIRSAAGQEVLRVGAVGELTDRRVLPPLPAARARRVVDLDGATFAAAVADVRQAWELTHAQ